MSVVCFFFNDTATTDIYTLSLHDALPISARSMSPVAMCGMPNRLRSMFAWVPLPLPGAPYRSRFTALSDEAAVLAHDELRLQLFHGVEGHTDDDEDGRTAEVHLLVRDARDLRGGDGKDHGDEAQEGGARKRDPVHDRGQVVRGGTARPDARDEARVAFEIVGDIVHLERDRGVEVRESERESEVERVVRDRHRQVGGVRREVAPDPG